MKKKENKAVCCPEYRESDLEQVFIIIGKYHNGKIRKKTIETLGVDMSVAQKIAEKNGLELHYQNKLSTE